MSRIDEIRELLAFHRWANETLCDALEPMPAADLTRDLKSSFASVRDTLAHMATAEWTWLERLNGRSPTAMPAEWQTYDLARIRTQWRAVGQALELFAVELDESGLDRVIDYRGLAGNPYRSTPVQILRHVVNHASYHRGQVTTMMRQLGATPPATDLIRYYRSVAPSLPPS